MRAYPSVNWWPENLRQYESRLSFALRFCRLNGISFRRGLSFLDLDVIGYQSIELRHVVRLVDLLHETRSVAETVFTPMTQFSGRNPYAPSPDKIARKIIRYCEQCARHGYHSHLFELNWISRCPFHLIDLKQLEISRGGASISIERMKTLDYLMLVHCQSWPNGNSNFPEKQDQKRIASLVDWVGRVDKAAAALSSGEFWVSDEHEYLGKPSLSQSLGQVQTLYPMPGYVQQIVGGTVNQWKFEVRYFSDLISKELQRVDDYGLGFLTVFDFYKRIGPHSDIAPRYIRTLQSLQECLRGRHRICNCRWRRVYDGREINWIQIPADEIRSEGWLCPFRVALEELELGWGGARWLRLNAEARREQIRLVSLSRGLHDAGLIRYVNGVVIGFDGYPHPYQDRWPCIEWCRTSPITELLNVAAEWEIEAAFSALESWLDSIAAGASPFERDDPKYVVRLRESGRGLCLLKWFRVTP
ncbi:hypothetical protein [Burkholderia mayonis]|uniref:hypothetical protein n=1 Tax=Burkholderia mayonis TaxID=1385591 RepID=UPI000AFCBD6D|nr:hypothetical protein [Burkholderia mayonis]